MRTIKLGLDVDEVVAEFQDDVLALANKRFGLNLTPESFSTWDIFSYFDEEQKAELFQEIRKPGFCSSLKVCPGALEAVKELQKMAEVFIITSPFPKSLYWAGERIAWLEEHFGFRQDHMVLTGAKYIQDIDVLVDDNPTHIMSWGAAYPSRTPLLWHIPNTRTMQHLDHLRVKSWSEVFHAVENLKSLPK